MPSFRNFNPKDLNALYEVRLLTAKANGADELSTLETIPSFEQFNKNLSNNHCVPEKDIIVVESEEKIIGYGTVGWWEEAAGTYLYLHQGFVLPEWRHKGIGNNLLKKLQERIKEIAKDHPTKSKAVCGANASSSEKETLQLLEKDGYKIVWSQVEMEFTDFNKLTDLEVPLGFEIKPVAPENYREVYEVNKKVYAGTWGDVPVSDEDYQEFLEDNPDPSLWTVAWLGNQIAGFVLSFIAKGIGVVNEVSVLPEFRRKGLARALLINNLRLLQTKGIKVVRLHTDAEGKAGARQLYESLGFKPLKVSYRLRKPITEF